MPETDGLSEFKGEMIHACDYKSGENYRGKKVLVVGYGNSGMELSLTSAATMLRHQWQEPLHQYQAFRH